MQRQYIPSKYRYFEESDDEADDLWPINTYKKRYELFEEEKNALLELTAANNGVFQVNPSLEKLGDDKFSILKPGDHITCHRSYIIYHHAIVVDVDVWGRRLQVIHYSTVGGQRNKCQIVKEWLSRDQLSGDWYRINYSKGVTDMNDTETVLRRAHSRLGESDYQILNNNCESFATFCKTGFSFCFQAEWLERKINDSLDVNGQRVVWEVPKIGRALAEKITSNIAEGAIRESTAKIAIAEGLEKITNCSNYVGGGLVALMEAGLMGSDIHQMYVKREQGKISRKVFTEMATQRVTEAVGATAGTIGFGLAFEAGGGAIGGIICSVVPVIGTAIGTAIGAFFGSILGGIIGSIFGRACGSILGPPVAKITTKFVSDDVPVKKSSKKSSCTIL